MKRRGFRGRRTPAPGGTGRRGSVAGFASATYAGTVLGIVTGPLIARALGAEGRGEYAAVLVYSSAATALLALGMTNTVTYALLRLRQPPGQVLGTVLRFCALTAIPAIGLAMLARHLLQDTSTSAQFWAMIMVATLPLGILQICLNSFLIAESALGVLARTAALPLTLSAAAVVVLYVTNTLTLDTYFAITVFTSLATLAYTGSRLRVRPSRGGRLGPQVRFGLRAYGSSLANLGNARLDQMLIVPVLGAADLGHYAVAVTVASLPLGISGALAARATTSLTAADGTLDIEAVARGIRRAVAIVLLASGGLAVIAPFAVPLLYGSEFSASVPLALVLLAGTVILAVGSVAGPSLNLANRPGSQSVAELAALIVTAAALVVLLPRIGVVGAAVASVLAYATRAALQIRVLRAEQVRGLVPRMRDFSEVVRLVVDQLRQLPVARRLGRA